MEGREPSSRAPSRWRADIQGLRAVAVSMVVAYHAAPERFPGGFAGVDVFFVISGFLITGGLATELARDGSISFRAFYARRIRRLLPAAALVLMATLVASRVILAPLEMIRIAHEVLWAALYVSNIHFAQQATDYLAPGGVSPVLHTWTLGVEEQFYLLWPLLLLAVARFARGRLAAAMAVVAVASFAVSIWWTEHDQPWAFFGLHARAWEFALGGLVALGGSRLRGADTRVAAAATWLGLALLGSFTFAYERTAFPGWIALVPVLGAVLLVAGGTASPRFGAGALLSLRPAQAVGAASYSFYLWHWPLLTLAIAESSTPISFHTRGLLAAAALALAFATTYLVENPVRRSAVLRARPARTYALGAAITALAALATVPAGRPGRLDAGRPVVVPAGVNPATAPAPGFVPSNLRPRLRDVYGKGMFGPGRDGCMAIDLSDTDVGECAYGDRSSRRTLALFGDSHVAQWFAAFDVIARRHGWRLLLLAKASCPSAEITIYLVTTGQLFRDCDRYRSAALERLRAERPFAVVVSNSRTYGTPEEPSDEFDQRFLDGLVATIQRFPPGTRSIVLADTPQAALNPPLCLSAHLEDPGACDIPRNQALEPGFTQGERDAAARAGAGFIDLNAEICPAGPCQPIHGNVLVFRDTNHVSAPMAEALAPELERRLVRCLSAGCVPAGR